MFKPGDKVVCIDYFYCEEYNIIKNKIYEIKNVYTETIYDKSVCYFYFNEISVHINEKNSKHFISDKEYRKQKLQKLNENR